VRQYRIRLRYSTIVNYVSMLYRMLVAVGFVVIVARRLSIREFGLWGIIFSIASMLTSPVQLWIYWVQRFYSRGYDEASGTGLILTFAYWIPSSLVYLLIAIFEERILGWGFWYVVLGLPLLLLNVLDNYIMGIASVVKPELRGYRGFIYNTLRLFLAYILIVELKTGLTGALLAIEAAMLVGIIYTSLILTTMRALSLKFSKNLVFQWISAFYVPFLMVLQSFLRGGLRAIVSWVTGSEIPIAYLNVGFASEAPLLQASQATTPALYAKILQERRGSDVEVSLRLFLLFTSFTLISFAALAKPVASLYNPAYLGAYLLIPLVAVYATFNSFLNVYATTIHGAVSVDSRGIRSHKEIVKSYLFKVPLLRLMGLIISYGLAIPLILLVKGDHLLEATVAVLALIVGSTPLLAYFHRVAVSLVPHKSPYREFASSLFSSGLVFMYYFTSGATNLVISEFWEDAPLLGLHLTVAIVIYIVTKYLTSSWFRNLVKKGLEQILRFSSLS